MGRALAWYLPATTHCPGKRAWVPPGLRRGKGGIALYTVVSTECQVDSPFPTIQAVCD